MPYPKGRVLPKSYVLRRRRLRKSKVSRGVRLKRDLQTYDVRSTLAFTNANATYAVLNAMVPGTGTNTRIGDKVVMKSIRQRWILQQNVAQALIQYVRVLLVWDKQPNGVNPANPLPLITTAVEDQPNPDYQYRFKIMKDICVQLGVPGATTSSDGCQEIVEYYKKVNLSSFYTAGAGAIADIATGALLLVSYCSTAVNPPTLVYSSRIHYEV